MNAVQNLPPFGQGNASDTDCLDYAGCATKFRGELFSGIQIELGASTPGGSLKASGLGDGLLRGQGVPPLRVAGILPAIRGPEALVTEEQRARCPRHKKPSPKPLALRLPLDPHKTWWHTTSTVTDFL